MFLDQVFNLLAFMMFHDFFIKMQNPVETCVGGLDTYAFKPFSSLLQLLVLIFEGDSVERESHWLFPLPNDELCGAALCVRTSDWFDGFML